jgi:hypothetical protein
MTGRRRTHAHDCWSWGGGHYDCAVAEIERLREMLQTAFLRGYRIGARGLREMFDAVQAESEIERLREALEEIRSRSEIDLVMRSDQFELTALLSDIYQIADDVLWREDEQ